MQENKKNEEGRKEGRKKERKEGRKEERKEGRKEVKYCVRKRKREKGHLVVEDGTDR
jgi:hypothetical protein